MNNREKNTLKNKGQHLRDLWSKKKKRTFLSSNPRRKRNREYNRNIFGRNNY